MSDAPSNTAASSRGVISPRSSMPMLSAVSFAVLRAPPRPPEQFEVRRELPRLREQPRDLARELRPRARPTLHGRDAWHRCCSNARLRTRGFASWVDLVERTSQLALPVE